MSHLTFITSKGSIINIQLVNHYASEMTSWEGSGRTDSKHRTGTPVRAGIVLSLYA